MDDQPDWDAVTFEGLRLRQQREFLALPLREKLDRIGAANELVEFFAERRAAREAAQNGSDAVERLTDGKAMGGHEVA